MPPLYVDPDENQMVGLVRRVVSGELAAERD